MQVEELKKVVKSKDAQIFVISSQAHKGLTEVLRALKNEVATARGFRRIVFFSIGSFSNIIEQVGPIINSKKII